MSEMSKLSIDGEFYCSNGPSLASERELDNETRDELKEVFTLFDKNGDGLISTREVATLLRAIGQVPTVCEETDIVAQYALDNCSEIDLRAFSRFVSRFRREFDSEYELLESFRRFDKEERRLIDVETLRTLLTTMGEPLTEEEVEDWLEDGQEFIEDGQLKYEEFVSYMLSK